jgi:hypothetical protein
MLARSSPAKATPPMPAELLAGDGGLIDDGGPERSELAQCLQALPEAQEDLAQPIHYQPGQVLVFRATVDQRHVPQGPPDPAGGEGTNRPGSL